MSLTRPEFATVREYGARLGDVDFWAPFVSVVLARHGLPVEPLQAGFVGTFPTFLSGPYVVKLFGERFEGALRYENELSIHQLLAVHTDVPAPALVAHGRLFEDPPSPGWPWPYLVTTRLWGTAWRDLALPPDEGADVARSLGRLVRRVHDLPLPAGPWWERDGIAGLRHGCLERHRRWGTLPAALVAQIDGFLAPPSPALRLLHADLTGDHLFIDSVERPRLEGIIDWGDARLADPYYDLSALHLHAFRADKSLLAAFLDGYGWEIGPDFARRAMTMTLTHEFDVLSEVRPIVPLHDVATLGALAVRLWSLT